MWVGALAAWHLPAAYDAALRHPWLHVLEHATFVGAGFLIWAHLIDPARRSRLSTGGRARSRVWSSCSARRSPASCS